MPLVPGYLSVVAVLRTKHSPKVEFFHFQENSEPVFGAAHNERCTTRDHMVEHIHTRLAQKIHQQNVVAVDDPAKALCPYYPDWVIRDRSDHHPEGKDWWRKYREIHPFVCCDIYTVYHRNPLHNRDKEHYDDPDVERMPADSTYSISASDGALTFAQGIDILSPDVFDTLPLTKEVMVPTYFLTIGLVLWEDDDYGYSTASFFSFAENREFHTGQTWISTGQPTGWTPRDQMLAKMHRVIAARIRRQNTDGAADVNKASNVSQDSAGEWVAKPFVKFNLHKIYDRDPLFYCSDLMCEPGDCEYAIAADGTYTHTSGEDLLNPDVFSTLVLSKPPLPPKPTAKEYDQ